MESLRGVNAYKCGELPLIIVTVASVKIFKAVPLCYWRAPGSIRYLECLPNVVIDCVLGKICRLQFSIMLKESRCFIAYYRKRSEMHYYSYMEMSAHFPIHKMLYLFWVFAWKYRMEIIRLKSFWLSIQYFAFL